MKIKLAELRKIIAEAFTEHQIGIMKSMLQSALRNVERFVRVLAHNEGDRGTAIKGLAASTKELKGWAPVYGRYYPKKAAAAKRVYDIVAELDRDAVNPVNSLFKSKLAKKAEALYRELGTLCENDFDVKEYDMNYAATDDRHFTNKSNDVYVG